MAFLGALVTIEGVEAPIVPVDEAGAPIDSAESVIVSGKFGRAVTFDDDTDKYIVHLSSDVLVSIATDNLRPYSPLPYRDGGFDFMWPSTPEELPLLSFQVSTMLAQQGWCLVECITGNSMKEEAWKQAQSLPNFSSPKPELLPDFLGKGGSGKVAYLEEPTSDQLLDDVIPDVLFRLDGELSRICESMAEMTPEMMGFTTAGRRSSFVWLPFENREETMKLRGEPLTEEDVEDGVVERHLSFIRQRKVGFLRMVDNEGGELVIVPREDVVDAKPAKIPISPNKLLIYRADLITFSYKPRPLTKSLVLKTWLLEEPPAISMHSLIGGLDQNAEMIGIYGESIPPPVGNRIHIMALAGRMAGNVIEPDHSWALYSVGGDGFVKISNTRWDTDMYCTQPGEEKQMGKSYVLHSSLLDDHYVFNMDSSFFGIRDYDVEFMSPSQRITLEEGYTCFSRYGYTKQTLIGKAIPVYLGDTGSDWAPHFCSANPERIIKGTNWNGAEGWLGGSQCVTAARLSHCLGLTGGCSQIDTACSASLVAVQVASHNLRKVDKGMGQGRSHLGQRPTEAMAMGISVQVGPFSFIGLCAGTMLSPQGRCFTFNDSADGYARGEGGVNMFLKASDDESDVQNQYACLIGIAANQDGRSANLTAPNGPAQQACIRDSMFEAGRVAREICVAECHGTGTALGDPIEVGALRGVMEPRTGPIAEGSSKSHVGHLEANAGITGLTKAVLMMNSSACPPNVHLQLLNHNLDMSGFPVYFCDEFFDTRVEAGVSGVSSFGFGGTNARADCWSRCRRGIRKTGEHHIDTNKIKHLQVQCPVTLGPIDYLTGEPVSTVMLNGPDKRTDVLRDVLAPYDISRYVYNGGFRFRLVEALDAYEEDLPTKTTVQICGTWSGWQAIETMERKGDGIYAFTIVLGDARFEKFFLCLNGDRTQLIYPVIKNASELIHVKGPDHKGQSPIDIHPNNWIIDGRDQEVAVGTAYQIFFKWGTLNKQVWWEEVSPELAPTRPPFQHRFSVISSATADLPQDMVPSEDEPETWIAKIKIGGRGWETFHFARDGDTEQAIYPARAKTSQMGVPAQGPDEFAEGRTWRVNGETGDVVTLSVRLVDAQVHVQLEGSSVGCRIWDSLEGWDRHHYYVLGSWNGWEPTPLIMDPGRPGVFRTRVTFTEAPTREALRYMFRVAVDGIKSLVYYPDCESGCDTTVFGKYIVNGPGVVVAGDKRWVLTSPQAGVTYEINFNPGAADKRQIVTWFYVPPADETAQLSLGA